MPKIKKKGYSAKDHQEQEILTIAHRFSALFTRYEKQLTIVGSLVAAVLVVMALYSLIRSHQEQKASPLVAAAYEFYSPSTDVKPDDARALELFRDIQKKYSATKSGAIAQYYIGNCLVNLGRTDEAIREYLVFTKKYPKETLLLSLVYQRLGYTYRKLGNQADAVQAFEQAEKVGGPGVATYELAGLYEASGNIPESLNKYKQVLDRLSGTSWGLEAMGKVQKIGPTPQPAAGNAVR